MVLNEHIKIIVWCEKSPYFLQNSWFSGTVQNLSGTQARFWGISRTKTSSPPISPVQKSSWPHLFNLKKSPSPHFFTLKKSPSPHFSDLKKSVGPPIWILEKRSAPRHLSNPNYSVFSRIIFKEHLPPFYDSEIGICQCRPALTFVLSNHIFWEPKSL